MVVVGSYPLSCQVPTDVEVELGCDNCPLTHLPTQLPLNSLPAQWNSRKLANLVTNFHFKNMEREDNFYRKWFVIAGSSPVKLNLFFWIFYKWTWTLNICKLCVVEASTDCPSWAKFGAAQPWLVLKISILVVIFLLLFISIMPILSVVMHQNCDATIVKQTGWNLTKNNNNILQTF